MYSNGIRSGIRSQYRFLDSKANIFTANSHPFSKGILDLRSNIFLCRLKSIYLSRSPQSVIHYYYFLLQRVRSDDGYYYDVPPAPRGFDTVRRVQSRRLPTVPTMFIPPETMQAVLRSLSRDTGEMERPTLEHQPGGRSETIIREEVRLFKKSQLRRVLSL